MLADNSDESWEALGKIDPYYGVLTDERFRRKNLQAQALDEFFASGARHIGDLLQAIEAQLGPVARGRALDFGCGVGRLTLPLAREARFSQAVGVDVSDSMLKEAQAKAEHAGLTNLQFLKSDDALSRVSGEFDFVHTFIVLQHIPIERGMAIVRQLLGRLGTGGVAALQVPFIRSTGRLQDIGYRLRVRFKPLRCLGNVVRGRPWNEPLMQMNSYDLNALMALYHAAGMERVMLQMLVDHGNLGAYLIARRS